MDTNVDTPDEDKSQEEQPAGSCTCVWQSWFELYISNSAIQQLILWLMVRKKGCKTLKSS